MSPIQRRSDVSIVARNGVVPLAKLCEQFGDADTGGLTPFRYNSTDQHRPRNVLRRLLQETLSEFSLQLFRTLRAVYPGI